MDYRRKEHGNYGRKKIYDLLNNNQSLSINTQTLPSVNPNTNRFNENQGYTFDKVGNIVQDVNPVNNISRSFTFNGDNKQTKITDSTGVVGEYFYDGEGKRVKKKTQTELTIFVYSNGKLIAEYSTATPTPNPTTNYTATDTLGSPRVLTDSNGQVKSRRDFMPFGEEIGVNTPQTAGRNSNPQYNSGDNVRQKFTGYQKDNESNLDFAEARYYNSNHGRFTAVDPLLASGKSSNPQTFNRFVYTGNSPIIRIDPSGKDWIITVDQVKVNVQVLGKNGKMRTVQKTISVETPFWVEEGAADSSIPRANNVWRITIETPGWVALHPTQNISSQVFATEGEAAAQYKQWLIDDRINFVDSGQGLPSELPENKEAIKSRVAFMVNSADCETAYTNAGLPTPSQVLQNRGLTIADPEILRDPKSVGMIGSGFYEDARKQSLGSLNNSGVEAFTAVSKPGEEPKRVFMFFKPENFRRTWFGFGTLPLNYNSAHEFAHGANAGRFARPSFLGQPIPFTNDLTNYPHHDNIITPCTIH
jgi:RHS repeat-associated protein